MPRTIASSMLNVNQEPIVLVYTVTAKAIIPAEQQPSSHFVLAAMITVINNQKKSAVSIARES